MNRNVRGLTAIRVSWLTVMQVGGCWLSVRQHFGAVVCALLIEAVAIGG
jgi:hypothetical protein